MHARTKKAKRKPKPIDDEKWKHPGTIHNSATHRCTHAQQERKNHKTQAGACMHQEIHTYTFHKYNRLILPSMVWKSKETFRTKKTSWCWFGCFNQHWKAYCWIILLVHNNVVKQKHLMKTRSVIKKIGSMATDNKSISQCILSVTIQFIHKGKPEKNSNK